MIGRLFQWVRTHLLEPVMRLMSLHRRTALIASAIMLFVIGGNLFPPAAQNGQPTVQAQTKEPAKEQPKATPPVSKQGVAKGASAENPVAKVARPMSLMTRLIWGIAGIVLIVTILVMLLVQMKRIKQSVESGDDIEDDDEEDLEDVSNKTDAVAKKAEVKKEEKKKEVVETVSTSAKISREILRWAFTLGLLATIGFYAFYAWRANFGPNAGNSAGSQIAVGTVPVPTHVTAQDYPVEVIMKAIADCESGSRQFEDDKVTPYKNRPLPGKKASTAFGKYQFLESHREPARKLGFDLNTEVGQDGYARYEIEHYGTKDWEFDQEFGGGPVCWGPKLRQPFVRTILAKAESPSEFVNIPLYYRVDWTSDTAFEAENEFGQKVMFDPAKKENGDIPKSTQIRFRSLVKGKEAEVLLAMKPHS